jgi:hypothetical protein
LVSATGNSNFGYFGGGGLSTVDRIDYSNDISVASVRGPLVLGSGDHLVLLKLLILGILNIPIPSLIVLIFLMILQLHYQEHHLIFCLLVLQQQETLILDTLVVADFQ